MRRRAASALVVTAAVVALARAQQEPPPVFRVEADAIEIDALVTDADGNPVTDLTVEDFELLEDGVP